MIVTKKYRFLINLNKVLHLQQFVILLDPKVRGDYKGCLLELGKKSSVMCCVGLVRQK